MMEGALFQGCRWRGEITAMGRGPVLGCAREGPGSMVSQNEAMRYH